MARRRSNGEGSYYQLPDRTWVHQITLGRKENGTLERKSFKGRTKAICKQRKEEWLAEQAKRKEQAEVEQKEASKEEELIARLGHSLESETLFETAFMEWLKLYKSPPTRKPSTYASYIATYNTHFAPAFGAMPLYEITQDVIQDYYQKKQLKGGRQDGKTGGLSPKTIRNHHMLLKDFFTYAETKYKLFGNPTLSTTRPEVVQKEMRVLTPDEMQIFMEVDTEALSLDNPTIHILNYNPAKKTHLIVQNTPETKSSNREIAISDGLCELLVRHLFTLANSSWPNPKNLLFPSKAGTHIDPKSFEIRLNAVSKRCEIKKVNPHALRHTLATCLVEERMPLNIVQGILGHSSIETTRKYLHKNADTEREAIASMTDRLDVARLEVTPQLNGAKKRGKFAGIKLPDFSEQDGKKKRPEKAD